MIIVWILLIVWGIWLLSPIIGRWLRKYFLRKMQRRMFQSMGIDPSIFEQYNEDDTTEQSFSKQHRQRNRTNGRKIIPEDYGEYVKFTVLEITGNEPWLDTKSSPIYVNFSEMQITDISWKEI